MYAIVEQGGKQYKVTEGAKLFVEKIDAEVGAKKILEPADKSSDGAASFYSRTTCTCSRISTSSLPRFPARRTPRNGF